jgi:hypothetical protein
MRLGWPVADGSAWNERPQHMPGVPKRTHVDYAAVPAGLSLLRWLDDVLRPVAERLQQTFSLLSAGGAWCGRSQRRRSAWSCYTP